MFKKLLSTMAAVAIMASTLTGFTVASAETAKVTCNVTDGSTNTNTAAIVLEFDGAVDKADLEGKVTITKAGTSDECPITVEVNGTKAQLKINAPKVNTGYTLTVPAGVTVGDGTLGTAFTRTFSTGTTLYTSSWSEIGTNADRLKNDSWSGTVTEVNNKNGNYLKFTGEKLIDYTLESEATDGILVIEYERYIPTKTTDANGDATETNTTFPGYGIYDRVFLDNTTKEGAGFYTIGDNGNQKITKDNWHTYRYEIDLKNKNTKFYLDGTNKALDADPNYTDANYAKTIKFQAGGGGTYNREMWIRNIKSYRTNDLGTWKANSNHKLTQSNGVTTITVPGTVTDGSLYTKYTLKNPITDGKRVKVSFDINANDKLKATPTEWGGKTSIRFDSVGGDAGGNTHAIWSPYNKPHFSANEYIFFNIADPTNGLAANNWHTYECVFEFDIERNKRIVKYVSVDGVETWCNFEKNGASLGAIAFFLTNGTSDENDAVLKVRNINVEGNYTTGKITVTPSFEDGAVGIDAKDMTLTFSESLVYDCDIKDIISIVDEENNPIASEKYSVTMNSDKKVATVTMNTDDTDSQKTYKIFIDKSKVKGNSFNDFPNDVYLSFTLPVIKAKATLGISSELEDGVENITPANMKFNFIPSPNDRIEDVSAYDISVDERTDMNSVIKVKNSDGSIAEDVIVDAELAEDCKSFTVSLSNYERYTQYTMEISNGSIVGSDGELMKGDFTFTFGTGEIDKPPYIGYSLGYTVDWRGQLTNEDKDGVTTFSYKNSVAQGNSSQRTEICYRLDEAISNAEGPIEVTYKFQINEGLANSTGNSLMGILSDSNKGGFVYVTGMAGTSIATDYTHYIRFYEKSALKVGVEDGDEWNTIKYIFDVDNGVVKNGYIQINDKAPINVTTIENTRTNFGVVEFRLNSMPNENGEYEDYIFKVKDMSVKSLGALKGTATSDDNENISLRFSYNVPYLFESDIKLLEWNDKAGDYTEVKQGYSVDEMDPSDMKQVNIHVTNGGLAYNKKYRVAVCRTDITAEDYVKLKITDIDFVTKEYPDNMKADVTLTPSDNTTIVNCSIVNLQDEASSAYVIVAGYNEAGEMVDKYCENITSIGGDNSYGINNISLSGSIKNVKVFIFKDDEGFDIYHMPQSFER